MLFGITPLGISKLVIDVNISIVIFSDFIITYHWFVPPQSKHNTQTYCIDQQSIIVTVKEVPDIIILL